MRFSEIKETVIKNSIWNFLTTIINRAGALIFTIILARFLLPEAFGLYNLAISIALIAIAFADLGVNGAISRYIAEYIGKGDKKRANAVFNYLLKLKSIFAGIISLLLALLSYPLSIYVFHKPELFLPLIICSFYVFLLSIETFFESLFYGLKKIKYLGIKELLSQSTKILFILPIPILLALKWQVSGVVIALILSVILILALMTYYTNKFAPFLFKKEKVEIDKKRVIKFLSYLTIGGITTIFFSYIDTLMIGILIPDVSYVGYYRAAFSLIFSIAGLLTFANILLPIFVQIKKERLGNAFNKVFKYSTLLTIPAIFGMIVLGKYILRLVYGYDYLEAVWPLYFLAPLIFEMTSTWLLTSLFSAREKPEVFVKPLLLATVMNIVLNYIFIKALIPTSLIWATTGAAIATIISRFFYMFILIHNAKTKLNIKINKKDILKPFLASLLFFILIFSFNQVFVKDMGVIIGLLEVLFGILIYFLVIFLIKGISKEDIASLRKIKIK